MGKGKVGSVKDGREKGGRGRRSVDRGKWIEAEG